MASKVTKDTIKEFVWAAHGNLEKVQQMVELQPDLLNLPHGKETAMGAACQMRCTDIIEYLLSKGAPMDISAACVLGLTDKVAEFLRTDPTLLTTGNIQSHGKKPLYFAENQPEVLALLKSHEAAV